MRLLVCGGRDYADRAELFETLFAIHARKAVTLIIEGGAAGADTLAVEWANANGIEVKTYRAEWERLGRAAGPIRNQRMLDDGMPDEVVAFRGGRGTAGMIRLARTAKRTGRLAIKQIIVIGP